jgi:hypothetical protein
MSIKLPTLDYMYGWLAELASTPPLDDGTPAYLFRGERSDYPETLATIDRHCRQLGLLSEAYEQLDDVAQYVLENGCDCWDLHPREAAAFSQHYGLPTPMFDFTSEPRVAVFFAANRIIHKSKATRGRIGVLDVAKARADACAVFDLRKFKQAKRPQVQHGFGLMRAYIGADDILDLKKSDVAEGMGLSWSEFAHLPDDETFLYVIGAENDLLSLQGDEAAKIPQDIVDQYVRDRGTLNAVTAQILADEIPAFGRTTEDNFRLWS